MEATPNQKPMPKASFGARAEAADGPLVEYPGPKAAEVTDVARDGAVVACGAGRVPPNVPRFMPGTGSDLG